MFINDRNAKKLPALDLKIMQFKCSCKNDKNAVKKVALHHKNAPLGMSFTVFTP